MLRLNRVSNAIVPSTSGLTRTCSWGGSQWFFFEPLQSDCCMFYLKSKKNSCKKEFDIPLNIEPKYISSAFDFEKFSDSKEKEQVLLSNYAKVWAKVFLSTKQIFKAFEECAFGVENEGFAKDKSRQISRELAVFDKVTNSDNLELSLRVARIVGSCERLDSVRKDILDKYSKIVKKK